MEDQASANSETSKVSISEASENITTELKKDRQEIDEPSIESTTYSRYVLDMVSENPRRDFFISLKVRNETGRWTQFRLRVCENLTIAKLRERISLLIAHKFWGSEAPPPLSTCDSIGVPSRAQCNLRPCLMAEALILQHNSLRLDDRQTRRGRSKKKVNPGKTVEECDIRAEDTIFVLNQATSFLRWSKQRKSQHTSYGIYKTKGANTSNVGKPGYPSKVDLYSFLAGKGITVKRKKKKKKKKKATAEVAKKKLGILEKLPEKETQSCLNSETRRNQK